MKNIADKSFFFALLFMIALPYTRVVLPILGEVNVKSYMLLFLLIVLSVKLLTQRTIKSDFLLNYSAGVFLMYFCISVIIGRDIFTVALQLFEYIPYIIACLVIATGTSFEHDDVVAWIAFAIAFSGALAAYIFYFDTQWMPSNYSSEADFAWGRLPWRNAPNVLIGLGVVLLSQQRISWGLPLAVAIGLVPAILTFSRSLLLAILASIFVAVVYGFNKRSLLRQAYFYVLLLATCVIALDFFDFENVLQNFESRIFGTIAMSSDISGHVSDRVNLYEQYLDVFVASPLLGEGFGFPFSTDPEVSYYADVTLVSFVLPFGVFGLLMFVLYVNRLWSMLNSVTEASIAARKFGLKMIVIIALLLSLNDDVWTHKEFSIVIAMVVTSFVSSYGNKKGDCNYAA